MNFNLIDNIRTDIVIQSVQGCQKKKHIQQVAYSTFHNCLTQICFNCEKIVSSIKLEEEQGVKA